MKTRTGGLYIPPIVFRQLASTDLLSDAEHESYETLSKSKRLRVARGFMQIYESLTTSTRLALLASDVPVELKKECFHKLELCCDDDSKCMEWIKLVMDYPFGKLTDSPPVARTQACMDKMVGHEAAKREMMLLVARWKRSDTSSACVAFEGPPGVGKTYFARRCAEALSRPMFSIPLGGVTDACHIIGHGYTYEGSRCGMIVRAIVETKCENPVIFFDELDKTSESVMHTIIHLTDPLCKTHADKYMGFEVDISRVMFIFAYNDSSKVCPILLDRLQRITFKEHSRAEKKSMAEKMLREELVACKLNQEYDDDVLDFICNRCESSLRSMRADVVQLVSCIALDAELGTPKHVTTDYARACMKTREHNHSMLLMYS